MANEITALERDGNGNLSVLLFYPIPVALRAQVGGTNVVPTPSADLPDLAATVLDAAEKTQLDAGEAMFHVVRVGMDEGKTVAQTLADVRDKYASLEQKLKDAYVQRYEFVGQRFDKA